MSANLARGLGALLLTVALAACSAVGGLGAGTPEPQAASTPTPEATDTPESTATPEPELVSTLTWRDCGEPFECSKLAVPLDHTDPEREELELALIRLPAPAAARRIGSLVVNPGGPGASGVDFVRYGGIDTIPAELRARFDIVGFDPRGVGASSPVDCGDAGPIPDGADLSPDSDEEVDALMTAARAFAEACTERSGDLLPYLSTVDVAHDLDLLRVALADAKLSYLGYSYGTLIGATYAELYGENVRALVLDGAVEPGLDLVERTRDDARALEQALADVSALCTEDPDHCGDEPGEEPLVRVFDRTLREIDERPVPAETLTPGGTLDETAALMATTMLLRERSETGPMLAQGWRQAADGDGSGLLGVASLAFATDEADQGLAALLAVNCLDVPAPAPEEYPTAAAGLTLDAPHFGPSSLFMLAACAFWPEPATPPLGTIVASDAPPLVVIGTTGDAVTPYLWSERLADQLAKAVLLTRDGESHTAFGGDNMCTDRAVIAYLVDLVLPDEGRSCG